eukprot:3249282-Pyramimonas_sp.AAC.2
MCRRPTSPAARSMAVRCALPGCPDDRWTPRLRYSPTKETPWVGLVSAKPRARIAVLVGP